MQQAQISMDNFQETLLKDGENDFFSVVKPAVEEADSLIDEWKKKTAQWIKEAAPKYIHISQVEAAAENLEQLVLQSYYKDSKQKRFKNQKESIDYFLQSILDELS
nr:YppE family protein [Metabacillus lacus]